MQRLLVTHTSVASSIPSVYFNFLLLHLFSLGNSLGCKTLGLGLEPLVRSAHMVFKRKTCGRHQLQTKSLQPVITDSALKCSVIDCTYI